MDRRTFLTSSLALPGLALALPGLALAADSPLPPPGDLAGKGLMDALKARKTGRAFLPDPLPDQLLSDLLWAGFGVSRPDGRRTAPSYRNWQEIDLYATTAKGLFRYEPKAHALAQVGDKDIRALAGKQDFVATAPLNLIYVADFTRMNAKDDEERRFAAACDTGFVSQNVYLFCAVNGLSTVVRANIDKEALAQAMGLKSTQWITLAQTVGYPKP